MQSFNICIAGIPIRIHCTFASTEEFCRSYLSKEMPAFEMTITMDDIQKEREIADAQYQQDCAPLYVFSDAYLETLSLYRKLALPLLSYNCIIFHGTVVAVDGYAYMFTAKSGTGKTTHAKLWLKNIRNSFILNGDKPLIRITNGAIMVCGTPWNGKENYGTNAILPLRAICFLSRDTENHIERISVAEAFPGLYQQMHLCRGLAETEKQLTLLGEIANRVELYYLACNMDSDAAVVSYREMSKHISHV